MDIDRLKKEVEETKNIDALKELTVLLKRRGDNHLIWFYNLLVYNYTMPAVFTFVEDFKRAVDEGFVVLVSCGCYAAKGSQVEKGETTCTSCMLNQLNEYAEMNRTRQIPHGSEWEWYWSDHAEYWDQYTTTTFDGVTLDSTNPRSVTLDSTRQHLTLDSNRSLPIMDWGLNT